MTTRSDGFYALLSLPGIYEFFQNLLGGESARRAMVGQYFQPKSGERILDIGCGPAELLSYFPEDVDFEGYDMNPKYIEAAKNRYGSRGKFYCQQIGAESLEQREPYDLIIASGVIHHLDDTETMHLLGTVFSLLKPKGRFITIDCCYTPEQSFMARQIISLDRGGNIRSAPEYEALARQVFPVVACNIRHDLLKIPYTHFLMECRLEEQCG